MPSPLTAISLDNQCVYTCPTRASLTKYPCAKAPPQPLPSSATAPITLGTYSEALGVDETSLGTIILVNNGNTWVRGCGRMCMSCDTTNNEGEAEIWGLERPVQDQMWDFQSLGQNQSAGSVSKMDSGFQCGRAVH